MMYLMMLLWVLFWAAVIYVIYKLIRGISIDRTAEKYNLTEKPMEILKKRYAAGEITEEEYERIKKELDKNNH